MRRDNHFYIVLLQLFNLKQDFIQSAFLDLTGKNGEYVLFLSHFS